MASRSRSRDYDQMLGIRFTAAGGLVEQKSRKSNETCDDSVGQRELDNPFLLIRTSRTGNVANGYAGTGNKPTSTAMQYVDYPCTPGYVAGNLAPLALPDAEIDWARFVASTNPSRPAVLLPAFFAEMRDIPKMVRYGLHLSRLLSNGAREYAKNPRELRRLHPSKGNVVGKGISLAREAAIANLSWQFGAAPFLGDILKMLDFGKAVQDRRAEINRLGNGRGLKRTMNLSKAETSGVSGTTYLVPTPLLSTRWTIRKSSVRWATIRYHPQSNVLNPMTDSDIRQMLLGLNFASVVSVAWELLPWSWLADYFGNIGDLATSLNNTIPVSGNGCLMSHRKVELTNPGYTGTTHPHLAVSPGTLMYEEKIRAVKTMLAQPAVGIPFLGTGQLSILGSLAVLKAR